MTKHYFSPNSLNLARSPFRNRTLFWLGLMSVLFISAGICGWTFLEVSRARKLEKERLASRNTIEMVTNREVAEFEKVRKQAQGSGVTLTPKQIAAMEEALALSSKREVSWTRLMGQLERELPNNIRVIKIAFSGAKSGETKKVDENLPPGTVGIPLSFSVIADKPETVTKFIREADRRGVFRFDPTAQVVNSKEGRSANETEFQMTGYYFPNGAPDASGTNKPSEVRQ